MVDILFHVMYLSVVFHDFLGKFATEQRCIRDNMGTYIISNKKDLVSIQSH